MAEIVTPYTYQPLSSPTAIRLLDWTRFDGNAVIYELREVDLSAEPMFDALSYTWELTDPLTDEEDAILSKHLTLSGKFMPIAANLELALRRIHHAGRNGPIWIDALCINQADLQERAHQVNMMGKIFASAQTVVAWLGKRSIQKKVLDFFESLPHVQRQTSFDRFDMGLVTATLKQMPETWWAEWLSIADILGSAWFSRVWIIQEAVLANQLIVYRGPLELSWDKLYDAAMLTVAVFRHHFDSHSLRRASRTSVGSISAVFLVREAYKQGFRWRLERCLEFSRAHGASDPRDKVFALLPISVFGAENFPSLVRPDYEQDIVTTYTNCANHLVVVEIGLDILSLVQDELLRKILGLPSWVPDFSNELRPRPLGGDARSHYDVGITLDEPVQIDGRLLLVESTLIDEIVHVSPDYEEIRIRQKQHIIHFLEVISSAGQAYATGEGILDVIWRSLTANTWYSQYPAPESTRDTFLVWLSRLLFDAVQAGLQTDVQRFLDTFDGQLPGVEARIKELISADRSKHDTILGNTKSFFEQFSAMFEDRRLFVTKDGLIGITSKSVLVGDQIHVVNRAKVPLCLRRANDQNTGRRSCFLFVGEAYVHGIMKQPSASMYALKLQKVAIT